MHKKMDKPGFYSKKMISLKGRKDMQNFKPLGSFNALVAQLQNEKIPFRSYENKSIIIPTLLLGKDSILQIHWEPVQGVILFVQVMPFTIPEERINEVAVLINRINSVLPFLGFVLNEKSGVLTYRTQVFLNENRAIPPGLIGALMSFSIRYSEQFLTQLQTSNVLKPMSHPTSLFDLK